MRRHVRRPNSVYAYSVLTMLLLLTSALPGFTKEITFLSVGYPSALLTYVQEEVAPVFKTRHNADVTVITATWDNRVDRLVVLTAGGTPPDIVSTGFYSPYEEGSIGLLEPLDRYLARWPYTSRYHGSFGEALSWQGQVMVMPRMWPRAIAYNKELYSQSGLDRTSLLNHGMS